MFKFCKYLKMTEKARFMDGSCGKPLIALDNYKYFLAIDQLQKN